MTGLAEFLLARIQEDEVALVATTDRGQWQVRGKYLDAGRIQHQPTGDLLAAFTYPADAAHAARWQPARVLAECEAKRRIVELHRPIDLATECYACRYPLDSWPCDTLMLLALPYADHPDYREEWKP